MSNVKRVFVEKKPEFAVAAKELGHEIRHYLGITDVTGVRVLIDMMWKIFQMKLLKRHVRGYLQNRL